MAWCVAEWRSVECKWASGEWWSVRLIAAMAMSVISLIDCLAAVCIVSVFWWVRGPANGATDGTGSWRQFGRIRRRVQLTR